MCRKKRIKKLSLPSQSPVITGRCSVVFAGYLRHRAHTFPPIMGPWPHSVYCQAADDDGYSGSGLSERPWARQPRNRQRQSAPPSYQHDLHRPTVQAVQIIAPREFL